MQQAEGLSGSPLAERNAHAHHADGHDRLTINSRPLIVLIAGAGIGGLTAAIALRQQGHIVKVFERSSFANEYGAAVHLAPNCNGILRRLGIFAEDFGSVLMNSFVERDQAGNVLKKHDVRESNKIWQHPWQMAHRVHLHAELKSKATCEKGKGIPVELRTSSGVKFVDEQAVTLTIESGEIFTGDVIIGADGVHSSTRGVIAPNTKPFSCGKSAFRFLIPREIIEADPATSDLVGDDGQLSIWFASDRRIVMYPTSDNHIMNFAAIHPDTESNAS